MSFNHVSTKNFALTVGGVLNICGDLTDEDCDLIIQSSILRQIQFARGKVNNSTLKRINHHFLSTGGNIGLRVDINGMGAFTNLDFLAFLPDLKKLTVYLVNDNEIGKINDYLQLEELGLLTEKLSIKEVARHKSLKRLFIGEKPKDIDVVAQMPWLESLTFSKQTLKSLDFLQPLKNLKELHFMLGGTKNLTALPMLGVIEKLSFMMVRQLMMTDLLPINQMKHLKDLKFDGQPHLTDLDWLDDKSIKTKIIACKNFK